VEDCDDNLLLRKCIDLIDNTGFVLGMIRFKLWVKYRVMVRTIARFL
jgi:hypothetical protein